MTTDAGAAPVVVTGADVVRVARSFLEVPWEHQGRSKDGIDCVGLITVVANQLGLSTFDLTDYQQLPSGNDLIDILGGQMPRIYPHERATLGDVLVLHTDGQPSHVGIVGDYVWGGQSLIHAFAPSGKVVEQRLDNVLWRPRVVAAFRLLEAIR